MPSSFDRDVFDRMINLGRPERMLSLLGGGVLAMLGLRRPTVAGAMMALAGGTLVARGLTGYCPVKDLLMDRRTPGEESYGDLDYDTDPAFRRHPGDIYSQPEDKETVDESSQESFPASDPPAFTGATAR